MRILVPTDFSTCAEHAVSYAGLLGRPVGASMTLVHVFAQPDFVEAGVRDLLEQQVKSAKSERSNRLTDLSSKVGNQYAINCNFHFTEGPLIEGIVQSANDIQADLIAMGTNGATGLTKLFLGSNTTSVIEHTQYPILAVPPQSPLSLPKKIVYATNFFDSDLENLKFVIDLVSGYDSEIYLLHVSHENMRSERDYIEKFSLLVTKETRYSKLYYYVMPHDDDEKGIELFIKSIDADLLVLSTRKRSFLEKIFSASLTKKIAYHLPVPLLAFHASPVA